jgi:hypothetical protein
MCKSSTTRDDPVGLCFARQKFAVPQNLFGISRLWLDNETTHGYSAAACALRRESGLQEGVAQLYTLPPQSYTLLYLRAHRFPTRVTSDRWHHVFHAVCAVRDNECNITERTHGASFSQRAATASGAVTNRQTSSTLRRAARSAHPRRRDPPSSRERVQETCTVSRA